MGSSTLDLDKHGLALLAAKSDVVNGRAAASCSAQLSTGPFCSSSCHWMPSSGCGSLGCTLDGNVEGLENGKQGLLPARGALFAYEKASELKLLDSGGGGPDELAKRFQSERIMYGLCRLSQPTTGVPHIVLIHWVGEKVLDSHQEACAGHLPAIRAFFKEAHLVLKASRVQEVTQEGLTCRLSLVAPPEQPPPEAAFPKKDPSGDPEELVGTNYQKTNPVLEILHTKRTSFWAQVEREEEERRQEERRRAQEERRCWERLRMEEERREAAERERRVREKEMLIQEQRKQQAQREAEEHQWEEARRREQARAIAGTSPQSWASETALKAAGPGGQQSPRRGLFQTRAQLGSSASGDPGPGVPRRPFLRYQRSLTESAYIFRCPPQLDLPGSFQASVAPPIGPKPGTVPKPASSPTSTLPAHHEAEAVPLSCTPPCLPPPALTCALNGTLANPPHLLPTPESEYFLGQESPLLTPPGSCSPPAEESQAPSHAPEGQMSPSPAQGTNGRAMDWVELHIPTVNSLPRAGLGETAPEKDASVGTAPGQPGSTLCSMRRGSGGEKARAEQDNQPHDGQLA